MPQEWAAQELWALRPNSKHVTFPPSKLPWLFAPLLSEEGQRQVTLAVHVHITSTKGNCILKGVHITSTKGICVFKGKGINNAFTQRTKDSNVLEKLSDHHSEFQSLVWYVSFQFLPILVAYSSSPHLSPPTAEKPWEGEGTILFSTLSPFPNAGPPCRNDHH